MLEHASLSALRLVRGNCEWTQPEATRIPGFTIIVSLPVSLTPPLLRRTLYPASYSGFTTYAASPVDQRSEAALHDPPPFDDLAALVRPRLHRRAMESKSHAGAESKPLRGPWTKHEDTNLERLVGQYGSEKWVVIAQEMITRSGKQCRERWHNHLNPTSESGAPALHSPRAQRLTLLGPVPASCSQ
jgi:hypothetical protein